MVTPAAPVREMRASLQNRVTPFGDIIRTPARGTLMGNRGRLHDANRELGRRRWTTKAWIACQLEFKGRWRAVMASGRYTELFFLDEVTALTAGHRPCAECRRDDWRRFADCWQLAVGPPGAGRPRAAEIDRRLHDERVGAGRSKAMFEAVANELPDGAFVVLPDDSGTAWLRWAGLLHRWAPGGYDRARPAPSTPLQVLTPRSIVDVLAAGYRPGVHATVAAAR
jgi:hypothetical protein